MEEDEKIDLELMEETPEVEEKADEAIPPEQGIDALKRQLDAERARRLQAEQRAEKEAERAYKASAEAHETNIQIVESAIDQLNRDIDILTAGLESAMRNQNAREIARINKEIISAQTKLERLENGREALQDAPKPSYEPPRPSDPVEAFASQLTGPSAEWIRKHPEYVTDQRLYQRMIGAHNLVVTDGIAADTPEYFAAVERMLGISGDGKVQSKAPAARDVPPPRAPANQGGSGESKNRVRLSAAEIEMAEMMGMKPEEYARNKLRLQEEGKLR